MRISARSCLALIVLLGTTLADLRAQDFSDRPAPLTPRQARAQKELDHLEALKLYGMGLFCERDSRLLEALQKFEEAVKIDPEAGPLHRILIPLYLALNRNDEALAACRKTLDCDPDDFEIWYLYGRQLKGKGQPKEASAALTRALACPGLKEQADQFVQIALDLGALAEETQDIDKALAVFAQIVDVAKGAEDAEEVQVRAAEAYVRVCLKAKRYDQALTFCKTLDKVLRLKDPIRAGRLNYYLANICLGRDVPEQALGYLDDYLKTQPPGTEAYELKITILKKLQRTRDILPVLEKYAAQDAHNVPLQLLLAGQCAEQGQADRAERIYRELIIQTPSPEVYRGLFNLRKDMPGGLVGILVELNIAIRGASDHDEQGKQQTADPTKAAQARAMLMVLRDNVDLAKSLIPTARAQLRQQFRFHPDTKRFFAVFAARAKQLEEAEEFYVSCLDSHLDHQVENDIYFGLIHVLLLEHKHEKIIEVCRRGLKEAQAMNRVYFHQVLSRSLAQLGKAAEAVAEADQAVNLAGDADRLNCRLSRVGILQLVDRYDQAAAECQALLKEATKAEEIRDIRYTLSNVYSAAKDLPKAEEQLRLVLKADDKDATANNDLGYLMADHGQNLEEAEQLVRKAIKLDREQKKSGSKVGADDDRDNAAYIDSLGWVLFRRGRLDAARRELEKAVALPEGADDPVVWDHLGDVYFRLDDPGKARSVWRKAVTLYETEKRRKLDDTYKELKHKLKLLELEAQQ